MPAAGHPSHPWWPQRRRRGYDPPWQQQRKQQQLWDRIRCVHSVISMCAVVQPCMHAWDTGRMGMQASSFLQDTEGSYAPWLIHRLLLASFLLPTPLCVVSLPTLPTALDLLPQGLHCVGIWAGSRAEALALLLDPLVLRCLAPPPPPLPSSSQQRASPSSPGADPSASSAPIVVIVGCPSSAFIDTPPGATSCDAESATSMRALPLSQRTAHARRTGGGGKDGDGDDVGGEDAVLEVIRSRPAASPAAWLGQAGMRLIR